MSEKKIVTVPSAAATRAMSVRCSSAQSVKSSSELIRVPRTPCSRRRLAVSTTVRTALPATVAARSARGFSRMGRSSVAVRRASASSSRVRASSRAR